MGRPLIQAFFATRRVEVPFRTYAIAQWTVLSTYALNAIAEMTDIAAQNGHVGVFRQNR
ncbi:hypothetical protein [Mesorhizobium sp. NZP2077]|uniref:hypothetical protein n=1 Tax=Mesorhizobium sp. NZP2077 TaxID=2483404 RepID=UPI001553EA77|nr:hypothetical protein [Mesorhizobium sp. NZP2077]QKD18173.1 hypothetical protein HGP13_25775 [Mesorhizobium sp. NZP2077]